MQTIAETIAESLTDPDLPDGEDDELGASTRDGEVRVAELPPEAAGQRLDKALSGLFPDISRTRLQALLQDGAIRIDHAPPAGASFKVKGGEAVEMIIPAAVPDDPQPQDIPLDILYEDDDLLVINKPAGLVVHPGAGNHDGTLVNALLYHCGDSLSGIGGVRRPGIVHRLDKETSGLMLVAKNDHAHQHLSEQLQSRSLSRTYWALTVGRPLPAEGTVDQPLDRHATNRLKMAVRRGGRDARTHYRVMEGFGKRLALVECKLETGRTHQIRVHMDYIRCPLLGDPLYAPQLTALKAALSEATCEDADARARIVAFPRQALHAKEIMFVHPTTEEDIAFESELPDDFAQLLSDLEELFA